MAAGSGDVNEYATQFIVDWILSNKMQFGDKAIGTCLGTVSQDGQKAYIFPSLLNQALSKAGYSPRKTIKYLAEQGIVTSAAKANGGKEYCIRKWFDNRTCRFVEFDIGRFAKRVDALDEDEAAELIQGGSQADENGFVQISNSETPFDDLQESLPY